MHDTHIMLKINAQQAICKFSCYPKSHFTSVLGTKHFPPINMHWMLGLLFTHKQHQHSIRVFCLCFSFSSLSCSDHFTNNKYLFGSDFIFRRWYKSVLLAKTIARWQLTMAQTSPGLCLFCYKNDWNDDPFQRGTVGESSTIHGKFFNIFQRYWNCTRGGSSIEEFTKEDVLQKEVLACCWECFTILDTFCRAFERWTSLKLELDGLLETLGISIASADNIPWMVNTFNDRYVECPEALEKLASCRDHLKGLCKNWF